MEPGMTIMFYMDLALVALFTVLLVGVSVFQGFKEKEKEVKQPAKIREAKEMRHANKFASPQYA